MTLTDALRKSHGGLLARALPPLREIERAVSVVRDRWPDAVPEPAEADREKLAQDFRRRETFGDWSNVSVARILQAAVAAFDETRAGRVDLAPLHDFLIGEVSASEITSFLSGMFHVYVGSFAVGAAHSAQLADALRSRRGELGARVDALVEAFPDLLVPAKAPDLLADIMATTAEPWQELKDIGFAAPHAPGLLGCAHDLFVARIAPKLDQEAEQERLINWLAPRVGVSLNRGAGTAIAALLQPWVTKSIPADRQSRLAEWIVAHYGDPRTHRGGIWAGFDPGLREVLLRWLAKEDMKFFCDVVTATQDSHMWPPRRDFWLKLHDQGRISEAWVAFGRDSRDYAHTHLIREGATNIATRFAAQLDRGGSTSLLIMRIGGKIVVDGCHSYKTHVFDASDPKAPKLYLSKYYCDSIRHVSRLSQSHLSIASWQTWVLRQI